jgi:hypothetical protein
LPTRVDRSCKRAAIGEKRAVTIKGNLKDMNLSSIITLNCNEGKRACLHIKHKGKEATIFFDAGQVVHAALGSEEGEEVIHQLLNWDKGTFEMEQNVAPPKHTITSHWQTLLLDGIRRIDESAVDRDELDITTDPEGKERKKMNIDNLNKAIDGLKKDLGDALIAADIWTVADGQIIAGINPQPKAAAVFNKVTIDMSKSLKTAGFPDLGKYFLLDLVGGFIALAIPLGDYEWGMMMDAKKAPLGLLLNVVIPQAIDAFEKAIAA